MSDENQFDHEGNFDLEATIDEREGGVRYTAPGAEQKWRARDLLDIHWHLAGLECPETYNRIMSCIIGHANPKNGVCCPSQAVIAIETGYCDRTVRRAIDWWVGQRFLRTEPRGHSRSLAYHPQWNLFEMHWIAVADGIKAEKEELRDRHTLYPGEVRIFHEEGTGHDESGGTGQQESGGYRTHRVRTESQNRNLKEESHPYKGGRSGGTSTPNAMINKERLGK
jgi:Helix-turn-helix domain